MFSKKDAVKRMTRWAMVWEKIYVKNTSDREFVIKIHRELLNPYNNIWSAVAFNLNVWLSTVQSAGFQNILCKGSVYTF